MQYHEPEVIGVMKAAFDWRSDWVATLYRRWKPNEYAEPFFSDSMYRSVARHGRHSPSGWEPAANIVDGITGKVPVVDWAMNGLEEALQRCGALGVSRAELFAERARHCGVDNQAVARFDITASGDGPTARFVEDGQLKPPFGLRPKLTVTVYEDGLVTYEMEALASAWADGVSFWSLYAIGGCDHEWVEQSGGRSWARMVCSKCGASRDVDTGD